MKNIIALGFFDGVHIGHRQILEQTIEIGEQAGMTPCALTMTSHPKGLLTGREPLMLNSLDERVQLIREVGISKVFLVDFTLEFAALTPVEFAVMVKEKYNCGAVVYGENYTFGKYGRGKGASGQEIWEKLGVKAYCLCHKTQDGMVVSSTHLRRIIGRGDVAQAAVLLARPFMVQGKVIKGAQKGRQIGFPTINLVEKPGYVLPGNGVYLTRISFGKSDSYFGITNVGVRPTFYADSHIFVESHILDYSGDLYGEQVCVEFLERIRPERQFSEIRQLKEQIASDKETALRLIQGIVGVE